MRSTFCAAASRCRPRVPTPLPPPCSCGSSIASFLSRFCPPIHPLPPSLCRVSRSLLRSCASADEPQVSAEFVGSTAPGELIEWLGEPTPSAAATEQLLLRRLAWQLAAKGPEKDSAADTDSSQTPWPLKYDLASLGPWARVQSRLNLPSSPYAPNGELVVERCAPISRLRPRPPPPPPGFLDQPVVGMPLQRWLEGAWWDVKLDDAWRDDTDDQPKDSGAAKASDAAEASDAAAESNAAAKCSAVADATRSRRKTALRYKVSSKAQPDISGTVRACELRPCWKWEGGGWATVGPPANTAAGTGASTAARTAFADEASAASVVPSLKGMSTGEITGAKLRVWLSRRLQSSSLSATRAHAAGGAYGIPHDGIAIGYVAEHGVSAWFAGGVHWLTDAQAWEWIPPTQGERLKGISDPLVTSEAAASGAMEGALVRVWFPASATADAANQSPPQQQQTQRRQQAATAAMDGRTDESRVSVPW